MGYACHYMLAHNERRGCPAGLGCTRYKKQSTNASMLERKRHFLIGVAQYL